MTDKENADELRSGGSRRQPTGDYLVGYCRPPKQHQFGPGNTANLRGRKKGSRDRKLTIEDVLFEPVTVREGDKVKRMPALEAVLKKTVNKALTGDHKAALALIGLAQKQGLLTPEQNDMVEETLSETDKSILADYRRRLGYPDMKVEN